MTSCGTPCTRGYCSDAPLVTTQSSSRRHLAPRSPSRVTSVLTPPPTGVPPLCGRASTRLDYPTSLKPIEKY
eukprot:5228331-Pleurochrysis_carterae.AAC.1